MAKQTVLDMVQSILSSLDSDEVNSIGDTIESLQVTQILKDTYFEVVNTLDFYEHRDLAQLDSASLARPTYMKLPSNVKEVKWIQYNSADSLNGPIEYSYVHYKYPDEFIEHVKHRNPDGSRVDQITDPSGIAINIYNDEHPQFWTSFDDEYIVFDNYDKDVESFLQNSKSLAFVVKEPSWISDDDFIPDLPLDAFSYFLEEARSTAFFQLKQAPDEKAEQKANRQRRIQSRKNFRAKGGVRFPDYGRKGPFTRQKDPTFRRD